MQALTLELPSVDLLRLDVGPPVDPEAILEALLSVRVDVYRALKDDFDALYARLTALRDDEERADDDRQWGR